MSTNQTEISQSKKDDIVKTYLNELQKSNNKKPFVYLKRENNGDVIFLDNINESQAVDIKKYTIKEYADLFNQILDEENKKETTPYVTKTIENLAKEIANQMSEIDILRKATSRLEDELNTTLEDEDTQKQENDEERKKEIIETIKTKNIEITALIDKLDNNLNTLRRFNPEPFETNPKTDTGKLIQEYDKKAKIFVNNLIRSARINDEQTEDVTHVAIEDPQPIGQTVPTEKIDLSGNRHTFEVEDISQPPPQFAKIIPDNRDNEMSNIISDIDSLAGELYKLEIAESDLAKTLHNHAIKDGEPLSQSDLNLKTNRVTELSQKIIDAKKNIETQIDKLKDEYKISGTEWDELTKNKNNIAQLKFNNDQKVVLLPPPYSEQANELIKIVNLRHQALASISVKLNEAASQLKQSLQEEHTYFEKLKLINKDNNKIENYVELENKCKELKAKIIEQQNALNHQIQTLNNTGMIQEEWGQLSQQINKENLSVFHIEYDQTAKMVTESSTPNRDDFGSVLDNLKQKNTQKQAKSNISELNHPNTVTATQEERKWLRAMRDATIKSLESSGIETKLINPKPSWKDKNYTISDTSQKVDIKLSTNSVETKNPTNANLKAMSAAIAVNVFARISKEPPENPKVTLGDCKPPEVAREFAKQIELALTNLKNQNPNHNDKINMILEKFKSNHIEPLNTVRVSLENQENEPPQPAPSTQKGNRF